MTAQENIDETKLKNQDEKGHLKNLQCCDDQMRQFENQ